MMYGAMAARCVLELSGAQIVKTEAAAPTEYNFVNNEAVVVF